MIISSIYILLRQYFFIFIFFLLSYFSSLSGLTTTAKWQNDIPTIEGMCYSCFINPAVKGMFRSIRKGRSIKNSICSHSIMQSKYPTPRTTEVCTLHLTLIPVTLAIIWSLRAYQYLSRESLIFLIISQRDNNRVKKITWRITLFLHFLTEDSLLP